VKRLTITMTISSLLLILMAATFLTGCSKKKESTTGVVVRYGYQPADATLVNAKEKGFFEEEFTKDGITFEFSKFASGPPMITALTAGSLDFGQVGDQPAIAARGNNVDIKAIFSYAEVLRIVFSRSDLSLAILPDDIAWVEKTADFMYKQNLTETKVNVGDLIDTSYLKAAGIQ